MVSIVSGKNKEGLLPCPFCGSADVTFERLWHGYHRVSCTDCGADGPAFDNARKVQGRWPKDAAGEAWNRREANRGGD